VNYNIPVFRTLRSWLKLDAYNLLDNNKLIAWNTTVRPDPNSPKDNLGLPTGFVRASTFGTATGEHAHQKMRPRVHGGAVPMAAVVILVTSCACQPRPAVRSSSILRSPSMRTPLQSRTSPVSVNGQALSSWRTR
jgi:hypothetical protein